MVSAVVPNVLEGENKLQKDAITSGSSKNDGPGLIFKIRSVIGAVERQYKLHELNPLARELLTLIAEREAEGAPARPSDLVLSTRLGTPPTIYNRVARLEEGGWIIKAQDGQDARAVRIFLSARGKAAFKAMSAELRRKVSPG